MGVCPHCDFPSARGDQCDNCGRTLDPKELLQLRCVLCGTTPEFRESEHFFLKLTAFQQPLLEWVKQQSHWRPNVLNFTRRYLENGLKDRAITRDLSWGVPIPVEGYEGKRIYVWFEAVTGYLSAAVEWAHRMGTKDKWQDFWKDPDTKSYYFIGKDNIPFHTIVWPAMLMGYGSLNLPYDVPANEFLSLENRKFSTSQNWAVWLPDYLERFDPDPLRYLLSIGMPETSDADFSWAEFVRRNNEELVATYGNLVNRVLSFTYRNFEGQIPTPGPLSELDEAILNNARTTMESVDHSLYLCRFKAAIGQAFSLAQEANRYLDKRAPWKHIKTDPQDAATTLWVAIRVINCLKLLLYPFLPFSSQKLHHFLGFEGRVEEDGWDFQRVIEAVKGGMPLRRPEPLYTKLDSRSGGVRDSASWRQGWIGGCLLKGLDERTASIYTPVQSQLAEVEERLRRLCRTDVPHLESLLDYVMNVGGKRIRPAITLLASDFYPSDREYPIIMAGAVELLHLATLIHDDTVDDSDLRRGKATVSSLWGKNVSVLFGDYLFATSATLVCDTNNVRVIRRFAETIMELASGELMEYFNTYDPKQARDLYYERIYRKTASLFCTAAETGAILGGMSGASDTSVAHLRL